MGGEFAKVASAEVNFRVYGGGGCSPEGKPSNKDEVLRITESTKNRGWDGVDFDDECNMNTDLIVEAMKQLKVCHKDTSFGFIAGYSYTIWPQIMEKTERKSEKTHPARPV